MPLMLLHSRSGCTVPCPAKSPASRRLMRTICITPIQNNFSSGISSGCALRHPLARGPAKHRMQLLTHSVNWPFSSSNVIQAGYPFHPSSSGISPSRHPSPLRGALQSAKKSLRSSKLGTDFFRHFAEEEGFEPPVHCCTIVFKTTAIDHSAIPPGVSRNFGTAKIGKIF